MPNVRYFESNCAYTWGGSFRSNLSGSPVNSPSWPSATRDRDFSKRIGPAHEEPTRRQRRPRKAAARTVDDACVDECVLARVGDEGVPDHRRGERRPSVAAFADGDQLDAPPVRAVGGRDRQGTVHGVGRRPETRTRTRTAAVAHDRVVGSVDRIGSSAYSPRQRLAIDHCQELGAGRQTVVNGTSSMRTHTVAAAADPPVVTPGHT